MIRYIFISFLLLLQSNVIAQNLVPNPGFEQMKLCPTFNNMNLIDDHIEKFCADWENVGVDKRFASGGGGQYYHECTNDSYCGVPSNVFGFQPAHSGKAYAAVGFSGTDAWNSTHFYAVKLVKPIKQGKKYTLRMYVSLADSSTSALNNLGILLTTQKNYMPDTRQFNKPEMPNRAHLYSSDLISDKDKWTKIEGTIIADSNYEYLTIGNFFDFDKTTNSDTPKYWGIVYYYIDDVSVEETVKYITTNENIICKGTSTKLSAMGADERFFWSLNKLDTLSTNQEINYEPLYSGFVYLISTNGIDSAYIQVIDPPIKVVQDSFELCENNSVYINAYQPNASAYYLNDELNKSEFYINTPAQYRIKTLSGNCFREDTINVYSCMTNLYIPNAFTPNNDGVNDIFLPKGTQLFNYKLTIYNRWGQTVFESTDINIGWLGINAPAGTYLYKIYYENQDGSKAYNKQGMLNLIR